MNARTLTFALALLCLPAGANAQGLGMGLGMGRVQGAPSAPLGISGDTSFGSALAYEANSDPNTVMYCRFDSPDGTILPNCGTRATKDVDGWRNGHGVAAQTWTQNGTVPRVSQSNLYPDGYGAKHGGITGTWSGSNNLSLPAGNVINFASAWSACFLVAPSAFADHIAISASSDVSTPGAYTGWYVDLKATTGIVRLVTLSGSTAEVTEGTATTAGADNAVCVGRAVDGKAILVVNNSTPTVSASATAYAPNTTVAAFLGVRNAPSVYGFTGAIKEAWYSSTPITSASASGQANTALSCVKPGTCFTADSNTVMHCYATLTGAWECPINTGGTAWTRNGALTAATPARYVWPFGVDKRDEEGAGPFSDTNYFSQAAQAGNPMDFAGDFSCCFTYGTPTNLAAIPYLFWNIDATTKMGWASRLNTTGTTGMTTCATAGCVDKETTNTASLSGKNIGCYGRAEPSQMVKLNGGTVASVNSAAATTSASKAWLGRLAGSGQSFASDLDEFWCSSTPASDALFTRIQSSWLSHYSAQDWNPVTKAVYNSTPTAFTKTTKGAVATYNADKLPMTVTRTTEATSVVDGKMYRHPAGTLRSTPQGKLYEGSTVNLDKYSEQFDQAATWLPGSSNISALADQGVAPDGTVTMDKITSSSSGFMYLFNQPTMASSAGPFVHSAWFAATSGTAEGSVGMQCAAGTVSACTCARSDGGACKADINASINCMAHAVVGTTPVRLWAVPTCSLEATQQYALIGAAYLAAGSILAWGAQFETGSFPHQYCGPTLNATRTCNADVVTIANPLRPAGSDWTNLLKYSEDFSQTDWGKDATTVVTANSSDCPDAPDGSRTMDKIHRVTAGEGLYQDGAGTDRSVWLSALSGGVGCTVLVKDWNSTDPITATLTTTPTRFDRYTVGQTGIVISAGTCTDWCAWGGQVTATTTAQTYCPTTTAAATCGPGGVMGKVTTNKILNSEDMRTGGATAWLVENGLTATVDTLTVNSDGAGIGLYQNFTATNAIHSLSFDVKATATANAAVAIFYQDGTIAGNGGITSGPGTSSIVSNQLRLAGLSQTEWTRVNLLTNAALLATAALIEIYPKAGSGQITGEAIMIRKVQVEASAFTSAYCGPTGAAAKTCAPAQSFCVRAKDWTPESGRGWSVASSVAAQMTTTVKLYASTDTNLYWCLNNCAAYVYYPMASLAAGSTHTVIGCANAGLPSLYVDGVSVGFVAGQLPVPFFSSTVTMGPADAYLDVLDFNTSGNPLDFVP